MFVIIKSELCAHVCECRLIILQLCSDVHEAPSGQPNLLKLSEQSSPPATSFLPRVAAPLLSSEILIEFPPTSLTLYHYNTLPNLPHQLFISDS